MHYVIYVVTAGFDLIETDKESIQTAFASTNQ